MKKEFISPVITISEFRTENILTTSGVTGVVTNAEAVTADLNVSMSGAGSNQGTTNYELTW
jgi:hypothetical protein